MDSIAADPKAGMDEKKQMLEMLRRFEEAQADGEDLSAELDDEDKDELEKALAGIDLGMSTCEFDLADDSDEIDTNKLFHLLPQEHRDAFLHAIRNPDSAETKKLLDLATGDDAEDDLPDVLPWWEGQDDLDEEDDEVRLAVAPEPAMVADDVLSGISPPDGVGSRLIYNALAIS
jgi:hypothetical protein